MHTKHITYCLCILHTRLCIKVLHIIYLIKMRRRTWEKTLFRSIPRIRSSSFTSSCTSSSASCGGRHQTTTLRTTTTFRERYRRNDERTIWTSSSPRAGYSFGVIGGGTPSEITPIDDFMGDNKPKAKPMKRAATAQGTAQTEASDNRIGRGSANTIKEKPKDERIGQTHLLDILKKEKEKSAGAAGKIASEKALR